MTFKGLGYKLTDNEAKILSAFKTNNEIAFPVGCDLSFEETTAILVALTKKSIIKGRGPYQLTQLGKRIVSSL